MINALADKLDDPYSNVRPGGDDNDDSGASTKEGTVAVLLMKVHWEKNSWVQ